MGSPDTNLSTEQQRPGAAVPPGDMLDSGRTAAASDPAKGSPIKGAQRFGDDGAKAEF